MKFIRVATLLAVPAGLMFAQGVQSRKVLSASLANTIALETIATCRADGAHVTVAVLDQGGSLKAFLRDDGALLISVDVSRGKALAAISFGMSSADAGKLLSSTPNPPQFPGVLPLRGALLIKAGQEVVGSVGVSGAPTGDKDEACAAAALAKLANQLK